MRIQKLIKSERGVYEPMMTEEHVITQILEGLGWARIPMYRIREPIPDCRNCRHTGRDHLRGKGCKQCPCRAYAGRSNRAGIPDLIGWVPSGIAWKNPGVSAIPVYIECKRPGGVRRTAQIRFIEEANGDGCIAFFAESWTDCVAEFRKRGIELPG